MGPYVLSLSKVGRPIHSFLDKHTALPREREAVTAISQKERKAPGPILRLLAFALKICQTKPSIVRYICPSH